MKPKTDFVNEQNERESEHEMMLSVHKANQYTHGQ